MPPSVPGFTLHAGSPIFSLSSHSRTWTVSHEDSNTVSGLGFHYQLGRILTELAYTYSNARTRIRYDYNAAALGLNAVQVALAGDGWPDLTFKQNFLDANVVLPLYKRLSLRVLYRYEDGKIRDWHYNGVSVNPMPANNGAYLDFGPQDYKVHLFGALLRYEL